MSIDMPSLRPSCFNCKHGKKSERDHPCKECLYEGETGKEYYTEWVKA